MNKGNNRIVKEEETINSAVKQPNINNERNTQLPDEQQISEHYTHKDVFAVLPKVYKKIKERIEIWSKSEKPIEWVCVLTGETRLEDGNLITVADDFYEIPVYNLNRKHGLSLWLGDVKRISMKKHVVAMLHSHTNNDLRPSPSDMATFLNIDLLLDRSIPQIIANPKGETFIFTFKNCHNCKNSFFKLISHKKKNI